MTEEVRMSTSLDDALRCLREGADVVLAAYDERFGGER